MDLEQRACLVFETGRSLQGYALKFIFPWWLSGKNPPVKQERQAQSLGQKDLLQKEMETHSILTLEIPWTEEPW